MGTAYSVSVEGVSGRMVEVEADIGQSLPAFVLLGLPDSSLMEARERIRAAAKNSGHPLPARKLTVNLLPAGMPKRGPGFDLAIVVAAIQADARILASGRTVFLGELALDGRLRPVTGILPAVIAAVDAGFTDIVCPRANHHEASLVPGARVRSFDTLRQVLAEFGSCEAEPEPLSELSSPAELFDDMPLDFSDVAAQPEACEAAVIAAAGGHHMLLVGPPGSGKTMIADRMPTILPPLTQSEALEVAAIHSASGLSSVPRMSSRPPVEKPHHTSTPTAILGGGTATIRPGAASRAHRGILFMDEACEFDRRCLDGLRQPLESGQIHVQRARAVAALPARFQLIMACNPCPCGLDGTLFADCRCTALQRRRYFSRLSGPILDRVDVRVRLRSVGRELLMDGSSAPTSAESARRVAAARERAKERLQPHGVLLNADAPGELLRGILRLPSASTRVADEALARGRLSARGYDRVLRLAWTLADLEGEGYPSEDHVVRAALLREAEGTIHG
jgi:magnesium chelatase family protein